MLIHKQISRLTLPLAGQKFKASDFRTLRRPGVYLFLLAGEPLYVGFGKNLIAACSRSQYLYSRALSIDSCDEVLLYPCKTVEAAKELETLLIRELRPKHNRTHREDKVRNLLGIQHMSARLASHNEQNVNQPLRTVPGMAWKQPKRAYPRLHMHSTAPNFPEKRY